MGAACVFSCSLLPDFQQNDPDLLCAVELTGGWGWGWVVKHTKMWAKPQAALTGIGLRPAKSRVQCSATELSPFWGWWCHQFATDLSYSPRWKHHWAYLCSLFSLSPFFFFFFFHFLFFMVHFHGLDIFLKILPVTVTELAESLVNLATLYMIILDTVNVITVNCEWWLCSLSFTSSYNFWWP